MGKKSKPTLRSKLFDKTNSRNFTLVFIENIIDEEKTAKLKEASHRFTTNLLVGLTASKFRQKKPEDEIKQEDIDKLLEGEEGGVLLNEEVEDEEEDDEDVDELEHDASNKEVYLDQLRMRLNEGDQSIGAGNLSAGELDMLEEPENFDQFLEIISKVLNVKCKKENVSFKSDYLLRFNVNFEMSTDLSLFNFEALLSILFKLLSYDRWKRYIVEVPFDVISRLKKHQNERRLLNDTGVKFRLSSFSLGSQLNLSTFYRHFSVPISGQMLEVPILIELNFLKKFANIYFALDTDTRMHKMHYSFASFRTITFECHRAFTRVYIECTQAPLMFFTDLFEQQKKIIYEVDICDMSGITWQRTLKPRFRVRLYRNGNEPTTAKPPPQQLDEHLLGLSKTFSFDIPTKASAPVLPRLLQMAVICRERNKSFQFFLSHLDQVPCPAINYSDFRNLLSSSRYTVYPFAIHFALLVLFSGSYKILDALEAEELLTPFLDVIAKEIEESTDDSTLLCLEQCLYYLKAQIRECTVIHIFSELLKLFKSKQSFTPDEIPEDYVSIRRATLYPSHLELHQPVSLLRSRFTEMANLEYGIRMTVMDDNGTVLSKCRESREYDFIMDTLKPQLIEGITIGNRVYELLGSSTSQMRDCGCTLYAKDSRGRTADDVRNAAGKLDVFNRNVSKYIARFGLVFSQSMTIFPLHESVQIMFSPDIEGAVKPDTKDYRNTKRERYCLSDGIGVVARTVAEQWAEHLQLKADYFPSAYQIRFGGCKGMLTVFDIKKHAIVFRDSMQKYKSDQRLMGILKYSMPRSVFLNRPLINILHHLNVDRHELYKYYYTSTSSVAKATLYDSCAMDLIHTYATGLLPYEKILNSSISLLDEPFLRSIINYLIYYRLNFELKLKARIRVPNDCGRIAFGVLDETKTLEYGEVFFQYTNMTEGGRMLPGTVILEGEVMVTKFPCLQPGDVRKFKAVNVPALAHIKDCLVFPAKGPRSHCDEMSGSDLDGDEYAIFFDPKLYFPGPNRPPMDFPYGLSKTLHDDLTMEDMVDFFLRYLMMNNIGMVANTHLMYSDFLPNGLDEKDCEDLAYTYNISLDFPKTGIIHYMPRNRYYMAIRPDFMERNNHDRVYLSKKMLGEYYRHCALVERAIELSQYDYRFSLFNPTQGSKRKRNRFDVNQFKNTHSMIKNRLIMSGWTRFRKQATEAFTEYRVKVIDVMEQLEVENEVMLFADVYEDKKDVSKQLLNTFFTHFQAKFKKQCEELNCTFTIDRLYLASAWYAICYEKCLTYNGKPLLGLPWLVPEEICQLAMFSFSGKVATKAALAESVRTMHVDGEEWTIHMGINHKQLVPYRLEYALQHGMLFDYKVLTVYGTSVIHHYWCPFTLLTTMREEYPHLLPLHFAILEDIQLKIVLRMMIKYFDMIKRRIYADFEEHRMVLLFKVKADGAVSDEPPETVNEDELILRIVMKHLKEAMADCGRKTHDGNDSLPTISTIFNRFMFYLFDLCNRVNSAIYEATMEEIFLLKYAVFALSFLNKLDAKMDRKFYFNFAFGFQQHWNTNIYVLNHIYQRQQAGESVLNPATFPPNAFYSHFDQCLDSLFNTYLADNNFLVMESIQFYLLPVEGRVDLSKCDEELRDKLIYLSGVLDVNFGLSSDDPMPRTEGDQDNYLDSVQSPSPTPPATPQLVGDHQSGSLLSPSSSNHQTPVGDKPVDDQQQQQQPQPQPASMIGKLSRRSEILKSIPYEVKTTGLVHSTQILRLLLGHPYLFTNIIPRFDIPLSPKPDDLI